jgi:hypothetical protein
VAGTWVDGPVSCYDPECPGKAEPESDGDTRWYGCTKCGFEFGHQVVRSPDAGTCAIGVSAETRRAVPASGPVLLQIGRRPDDAH